MKLSYTVHSVAEDRAQVEVEHGGKLRQASLDVLVVELVAPGSVLTLRCEDPDEARKIFETGKKVSLTIAKGK